MSKHGNRLVSIEGGCDWIDASYELLKIPAELNLEQQKADYNQWFYSKENRGKPYKSFVDWLLEHGAKKIDYEVFES